MRSAGLVFAALLALTLVALPEPPPFLLTAGSEGAYRVRAHRGGLGFEAAPGAALEFRRARLRAGAELLLPSSADPRREGEKIEYENDGWSEQYWLRHDAV